MKLTVEQYINGYITNNLKNNEGEYKINDILVLMAFYFNTSKDKLYLDIRNMVLSDKDKLQLDSLLDKYYIKKIPLQYLTNKQYFFNEEYFVNENVLIPRQDTEILVEEAIKYINKYTLKDMLDMCTGSGCIGISIANNSDVENITLVDISNDALEVAKKNILLNNVEKNITIIQSNLFTNLQGKKFDIIVSNPPYIKTSDINNLDEHVKHEPYLALDGGVDGMDIYTRIIKNAKDYLNSNGILMLEIGYDELEDIKNILEEYKEYKFLECIRDFGGHDRVVVCSLNN